MAIEETPHFRIIDGKLISKRPAWMSREFAPVDWNDLRREYHDMLDLGRLKIQIVEEAKQEAVNYGIQLGWARRDEKQEAEITGNELKFEKIDFGISHETDYWILRFRSQTDRDLMLMSLETLQQPPKVVEEALSSKTLSTEFVAAWGDLSRAYGIVLANHLGSGDGFDAVRQGSVGGGETGKDQWKQYFVYWVSDYMEKVASKSDWPEKDWRKLGVRAFVEFVVSVCAGNIEPPSGDQQWFMDFLQDDKGQADKPRIENGKLEELTRSIHTDGS